MYKILIVDDLHPSIHTLLEGFHYNYVPNITRPQILEIIHEYNVLFIRSKTKVDQELLRLATNLQFIGRAGAGLDLIDQAETQKRNIVLAAANEGNAQAVAEHVLAMLLNLFNNITIADSQVRKSVWQREQNRGVELGGKTVGIIGYGHNGRATAQLFAAFGCQVLAFDKYHGFTQDNQVKYATLEQIHTHADIVSLHIPLTHETKNMVNHQWIGKFKKPIYFINIARGEIVNQSHLLKALQNGKIKGACLDVLENEKLNTLSASEQNIFDQLIALPNTVFSPHIAGWTHESYQKINEVLVKKLLDFGKKII